MSGRYICLHPFRLQYELVITSYYCFIKKDKSVCEYGWLMFTTYIYYFVLKLELRGKFRPHNYGYFTGLCEKTANVALSHEYFRDR